MKSNKIKTPVLRLGVKNKVTKLLWSLLVFSLAFAIFKNFTAIDKHTIHEKKVIEQKVVDTNNIESFVQSFAKIYYSWEQSQTSLDNRIEQLKYYLTDELITINLDMVRSDIPTTSTLISFQVWEVTNTSDNEFNVLYSIQQIITENENSTTISSSFEVKVHVEDNGNMVIIKNPTVKSTPIKSSFVPKVVESDGTVEAIATEEINDFLTTFFKLYPTATENELTYYVSNNALAPINKDYVFVELVNPVYIKTNNQISVSVSVKYLDNETKTLQISQFELMIQKNENWHIIQSK